MWDGRKKRKVSLWGRWAKTSFFFLFDLRLVAIFCSKRLVFACQNAARPSQLEKMSSNVWQSFVLRSKCLLNMWNRNLFAQTFASTMGLGALRRFDTSAARKKQTDDQDGFLTLPTHLNVQVPTQQHKTPRGALRHTEIEPDNVRKFSHRMFFSLGFPPSQASVIKLDYSQTINIIWLT